MNNALGGWQIDLRKSLYRFLVPTSYSGKQQLERTKRPQFFLIYRRGWV